MGVQDLLGCRAIVYKTRISCIHENHTGHTQVMCTGITWDAHKSCAWESHKNHSGYTYEKQYEERDSPVFQASSSTDGF